MGTGHSPPLVPTESSASQTSLVVGWAFSAGSLPLRLPDRLPAGLPALGGAHGGLVGPKGEVLVTPGVFVCERRNL